MMILLVFGCALMMLVGAAYELALLSVSRAHLAEAISRRLRGSQEPLAWSAQAAVELAVASATLSMGVVALGAAFPALIGRASAVVQIVGLVLLVVPFAMLSGYLLPRWLTQSRADRVRRLLRPLVRPWAALLKLLLPAPAVGSTGEWKALAREGAAVLPGSDSEMAMVGGVMTFAQRPVRGVMTPRTELVAVREGTPVAEISRTFAESGYSRIPVYRETLDEIVGMLHAFDLFTLRAGDPLPVRPVAVTPESRSCGDLLIDMQRERRHLAVVLDEFGGTLGIVTLEDLLTALVGEIYDEDSAAGPAEAPGRPALLEIDGGLAVEELEGRFGVTLGAGQASTVAGRLAERAGRIPKMGERMLLGGLEFDVLQASPTRAERLAVRMGTATPLVLDRS
jgi:CBS domain containing-hemolysin-like protein